MARRKADESEAAYWFRFCQGHAPKGRSLYKDPFSLRILAQAAFSTKPTGTSDDPEYRWVFSDGSRLYFNRIGAKIVAA